MCPWRRRKTTEEREAGRGSVACSGCRCPFSFIIIRFFAHFSLPPHPFFARPRPREERERLRRGRKGRLPLPKSLPSRRRIPFLHHSFFTQRPSRRRPRFRFNSISKAFLRRRLKAKRKEMERGGKWEEHSFSLPLPFPSSIPPSLPTSHGGKRTK